MDRRHGGSRRLDFGGTSSTLAGHARPARARRPEAKPLPFMNPAQSPVKPGDVVAGKYRVERLLGQGGMGVVVAATHLDLLEPRALKFMLPTALPDAETAERFLREARAASRLKSEHVARVHDVGRTEGGVPYIVMEYLDGIDLGVKLKREGARPVDEAVLYILQAAEALAEAHAAGIVHRDLKPGNLFITTRPDGTPHIKVLDFGISKLADADAGDLGVTKTHTVLGSPLYMSPEQMQSARDVDARSDIWSLGVILYGLLTGQLPYRGKSLTEMVAAVFTTRPRPPGQLAPHVPPGLEAVVLRCLEHDRAARFQSVAQLAESLRPFTPAFASFLVDRIVRLSIPARSRTPTFVGDLSPFTPPPPASAPFASAPPQSNRSIAAAPPASTPNPPAFAQAPPPSSRSTPGAPLGSQAYSPPPVVSTPPGIPPFGGPTPYPHPHPPPSHPSVAAPFAVPTPYPYPQAPQSPPSHPSVAAPFGGPTPSVAAPFGGPTPYPQPPPSNPSAATTFGGPTQLPAAMSASGAWGATAAAAPRRPRAALVLAIVGAAVVSVVVTLSILTRGPSTAARPDITAVSAPAAAPPSALPSALPTAVARPETPAPVAEAPPIAEAPPTAAPSTSAIAPPATALPEASPTEKPAKPKKVTRPADPFGMDRK